MMKPLSSLCLLALLMILAGCDPDAYEPQWEQVGLENRSIDKLVMSGNDLFATASSGGLYRARTDRLNFEWEYLGFADSTLQGSGHGVRAIYKSPTDGTLYVGLHTPAADTLPGIFRSLDEGQTWEAYDMGIADSLGGKSSMVTDIVAPEGENYLLAILGNSIFKKYPDQDSWVMTQDSRDQFFPSDSGIRAIRFNPLNTYEAWAASHAAPEPVLYHSLDEGETWEWYGEFGESYPDELTDIAVVPSDPSNVYISTCGGLLKTEESVTGFKSVLEGPDENGCFTTIQVNPSYNRQVYTVSGWILYRTDNGGFTWKEIEDREFHHTITNLAIDWPRRTAYVSTYNSGGVYKLRL